MGKVLDNLLKTLGDASQISVPTVTPTQQNVVQQAAAKPAAEAAGAVKPLRGAAKKTTPASGGAASNTAPTASQRPTPVIAPPSTQAAVQRERDNAAAAAKPSASTPAKPTVNIEETRKTIVGKKPSEIYNAVAPVTGSGPQHFRRSTVFNEYGTNLAGAYFSTVQPAYRVYQKAQKAYEAGTGSYEAMVQARDTYLDIYNRYQPAQAAWETLSQTDNLTYWSDTDLDELTNTLSLYQTALTEGETQVKDLETRFTSAQTTFDSAAELLKKRETELDAAIKAMDIAEKALSGKKKGSREKYLATWKAYETARDNYTSAYDDAISASHSLSQLEGEYNAQMLYLSEIAGISQYGAETYERRFLDAHPEIAWNAEAGLRYDSFGQLMENNTSFTKLYDHIEELRADNADGKNDAEIAYYHKLLNSGLAWANLTPEEFDSASEYFTGIQSEASEVMNRIALEYLNGSGDVNLGNLTSAGAMKAVEQQLMDNPEYVAAKTRYDEAQKWVNQLASREYDLTYEGITAEMPASVQRCFDEFVDAWLDADVFDRNMDTPNNLVAMQEEILRTILRTQMGMTDAEADGVVNYAKRKANAAKQDERYDKWYNWAVTLANDLRGVDLPAAVGYTSLENGGTIPRAAQGAIEEARKLTGSDDPGLIAAAAVTMPIELINHLAEIAGAADLTTQGMFRFSGLQESDPFTGKAVPIDYNTSANSNYFVAKALHDANYQRTYEAMLGKLGDEEAAATQAEMYQKAYDLTLSMGESTVVAGLSMMGLPNAMILLSGSAASQTMHAMHEQGYSDGYAITSGLIAGWAEYYTEKVSIEGLLKVNDVGKLGLTGLTAMSQLGLNWGSQILSELSEEGASDVVNLVADEFFLRLFNGGVSQIEMDALAKREAQPSLSYEESMRLAFIDWGKQTWEDMIAGGISGGLMAPGFYAIGSITSNYRQSNTGAQIRQAGGVGLLRDYASSMDAALAESVRLDYSAGLDTDLKIGRVAARLQDSIMHDAVRKRLVELGEKNVTPDLIRAVNVEAAEQRLLPSEKRALQQSEHGRQVARELAEYMENPQNAAEWTSDIAEQQESLSRQLTNPAITDVHTTLRAKSLELRWQETQNTNPDATVLTPIGDAIVEAGGDPKVAVRQGQLMAKVLSGENLTEKEMRAFDLNNPAVKQVFIERTGLTGIPEGTIKDGLKRTYVDQVSAESRRLIQLQEENGRSAEMLMDLQRERSAARTEAMRTAGTARENGIDKHINREIGRRSENNAARDSAARAAQAAAEAQRIDPDATEADVIRQIFRITGKQIMPHSQFIQLTEQMQGGTLTARQRAAAETQYREYLARVGLTEEQARAVISAQPGPAETTAAEQAVPAARRLEAGEVVLESGIDESKLNDRQKVSLETIREVAKTLGLRVHVYETQNINGWQEARLDDGRITSDNGFYDQNDELWLDLNAGDNGQQLMLFTASHELTHLFARHDREAFNSFKEFLFDKYRMLDDGVTLEQLIDAQIEKARQNGRKISREVAEEDVVADACERMLTDEDVLQTLADLKNTDRSLRQKIVDFFHKLFERIQSAYADVSPESREAQILDDMAGAFDEIKFLWTGGVSNAAAKVAAERYNEMAPKDLDGDPGPIQHSARSMVQGSDLVYRETDGSVLDRNGKEVKHVSPEQMVNTPLGRLVQDAIELGTIDAEAAKTQYTFLAELMNQIIETRDAALIWEIAGTQAFAAIRSNSDKQYGKTIDFSTICKQTQQMVDVMSATMMELGHGLTRQQVEMAYRKVAEAGEPVPCPVCYVFSRWIGIGGILDDMRVFQQEYMNMSEADLRSFMLGIEQQARDFAENKIKKSKNPEKTRAKFFDKNGDFKLGYAMSEMKAPVNNQIRARQKKISKSLDNGLQIQALQAEAEEAAKLGVPFAFTKQNEAAIKKLRKGVLSESELRKLEAEIDALQAQNRPVEAYQYLNGTIMLRSKDGEWVKNAEFKPVPNEVLFNLNAGAEFASEYPYSWKYRTTRGCNAGKAMLPYSDARVGETIQGIRYADVNDIYTNPEDNPFLNGDETERQENVLRARAKQRVQNLLGGMRYQSTSDFRFEYGSDYLITFLEMQAIGANVQLYTKVIEAVDFLATMGADVNLSVMPLGNGYVENADGTKTLVFSPVTGINGEAAIEKAHQYDNVQLILVGINDEHIRVALAGTDVTFVIPFHGSGNTTSNIQTLMESLGEDLDLTQARDYTAVQSDHFKANRTDEQKAMWNLRVDILTGKAQNLTEAQQKLLDKNKYLADLWRRFYVEGVDERAYHVVLSPAQANQIFPHEYWDKTSTYDTADVNGDRFQEYCATMGIVPRFSGIGSDGKQLGYGDFTKDKGYWKLLIDRSMYANAYDENGNWIGYGAYRDQSPINCTNFKVETLDPAWAKATYGDVMTEANDPTKTGGIVQSVVSEIRRELEQGERVSDDGVRHSSRAAKGSKKSFKNGQNSLGVFEANTLIDLTRSDEFWTGSENYRVLGMEDNDRGRREFENLYKRLWQVSQDMPEETNAVSEPRKVSFIIDDGAGKSYIYCVTLEARMYGTVDTKIDLSKALKKNADLRRILNGYTDDDPRTRDSMLRAQRGERGRNLRRAGVDPGRDKAAVLAGLAGGTQRGDSQRHDLGGARPVQESGTEVKPSARWSSATQGLNFRDLQGTLLNRVFDGTKQYETRSYTEQNGNGRLPRAYLNKPMGIIQTGAGPARLVGFWELGDGELRDSAWLADHAAELGNDGTQYEAKPGEQKWVYPIKWADQINPVPVTSRGMQARDISDIVPTLDAATVVRSSDGEGIMHSSRSNARAVEAAIEAIDKAMGEGTAQNLRQLMQRYEDRAVAAEKALKYEQAQRKLEQKQFKRELAEAKGALGRLERAHGKALRAVNNELNRTRREMQRRETALRKKMADMAVDNIWHAGLAQSDGEQRLKEAKRYYEDKLNYNAKTDRAWARGKSLSAARNARNEERRRAREAVNLTRQVLSLPGRAAVSTRTKFTNKANKVMMNNGNSELAPLFKDDAPKQAASFGQWVSDHWDRYYRAFHNDVNELDRMAKLQTRTDSLSTLVNVYRASSITMETLYRVKMVNMAGDVIGSSMEDTFLCHDENGKYDEKMQRSLEYYMFHKHNVDRMSLERKAVERVQAWLAQDNHSWLQDVSNTELAQMAADGNPIVQEYIQLMRWATEVRNKAVMADVDDYAVTAETSQAVVDTYEREMPWLKDKAEEIYSWWDIFMREWAVGSSISEADYLNMREMYPHYVPTYRADKGSHAGNIRSNATGLSAGEVVKAAKGSTEPLIHLEDQFVRAAKAIVKNSRQNQLLRNLVEELLYDDEGVFSQFGVYDVDTMDDAARQFWGFTDEQERACVEKVKIDGKDAYHISCWVDGRKMSAYVNRAMFEGLQSLFGRGSEVAAKIGQIGAKFTQPMKNMITGYNPTFAAKNFARDQLTALTNTNNGVAFVRYLGEAAAKIAANHDDWVTFQALGGVSASQTRVEGGFAQAIAPKKGVKKAWNTGKEIIGKPGEISESVTRFAEYLGALDRLGGNTYENRMAAIREAAEVTVDFGRHGSIGKYINMWVPYWNANMQGLDKMIRNIAEQPDIKSMAARIGRAGMVNIIPAALQAALLGALKRWKDYEELSDQQKDNYYCFPIIGKEHKFFKVPKSQDWAAFISTPFLRIMEGVNGRDDPWENWFESAVVPQMPFDMNDIGLGGEVPTILPLGLDWIFELKGNENYAGSAIIPYNLEDASAKEQYDADTSVLAFYLGQAFNKSPMAMDYIIDDYMGNFWGVIAKAVPLTPLVSRGVVNGEIDSDDRWADVWATITSPFITDNRYSNSTIAGYYEMLDKLEQEVTDAGAHGDKKDAEHYAIYQALNQTGGYVDQIRELTAQAKELPRSDDQAALRLAIAGTARMAMDFVQACLDGEVDDPEFWMTYHQYGDRIMSAIESLKKYESEYNGDFNFSGNLGQPTVLYDRSGEVDYRFELDAGQQMEYRSLRADEYRNALSTIIASDRYRNAEPVDQAAMLAEAKRTALKSAERKMLQYLRDEGIQGESIGKADYSDAERAAAYSVSWLLGQDNAYKPELTDAFIQLYDYNDTYSFVPSSSTRRTFKDQTDAGRVYVLDSKQQDQYADMYHSRITEYYDLVMASDEYRSASDELRAAMLAKAKTYAQDDLNAAFDAWLKQTGATSVTQDRASAEINLEAKYAIQRALGDDHAMQRAVTDELIRLYQYSGVGDVEFFPITTAPKSYVDDRDKDYIWILDSDQREVYMSMMFDIYQRNVLKVMNSSAYKRASDYEQAQMLCDVRSRLSGEVQAEFKNWLRRTGAKRTNRNSPEAQAQAADVDAAGRIVDEILGKARTYKQFNEARGY